MSAVAVDDATLLRAAELNLVEVLRHFARAEPEGVVHEEAGFVMFAGSPTWPGPFDNGVFVVDPRVTAHEVLRRAERFFADLGRAYCVWSGDHVEPALAAAARARGLVPLGEDVPQMVLGERLADAVAPAGVVVRRVTDDETRRDYIRVLAGSFSPAQGTPPALLEGHFGELRAVDGPNTRAVVAYLDGEPAAGAFVLVSHGIAGVQYVGTVESARRRGLGELVTRWVGNAGFDLGARAAALQASAMGEPIYRRMGYETVTRYEFFMGPPPS